MLMMKPEYDLSKMKARKNPYVDALKGFIDTSKTGQTTYSIDLHNPPKLTAEQQTELEALQHVADEDIDYSDMPATSEEDWKNAVVGKFYRPVKKQI